MGKPKFDGVVEAVRYKGNGEVDWVRAYERRGATYSDHVLIKRQELIDRLKAGKNFMAGKRIPHLASTFDVTLPVKLIEVGGREFLVTGNTQAQQDHLEGVPVICVRSRFARPAFLLALDFFVNSSRA